MGRQIKKLLTEQILFDYNEGLDLSPPKPKWEGYVISVDFSEEGDEGVFMTLELPEIDVHEIDDQENYVN